MANIDAAHLFAFPEDLLPPSILHPAQFQELWSGVGGSPERELALAIIDRAATDLVSFRFAKYWRHQHLYLQAYNWMSSNDCSYSFSFVSICDALEISASALRDYLLDVRPPRQGREAA